MEDFNKENNLKVPVLHDSNFLVNSALANSINGIPIIIKDFIDSNNATKRFEIEHSSKVEMYRIDVSSSTQKSTNKSLLLFTSIAVITVALFSVYKIDITIITVIISLGFSYFLSINKNILEAIYKISQSRKNDTN